VSATGQAAALNAAASRRAAPKPWRGILPVHPAADAFPLLPPDELSALALDIVENGLRESPSVWLDPSGDPYLLDGRNRLDAMESIGATFLKLAAPNLDFRLPGGPVLSIRLQVEAGDPAAAVISANIHRRHLTPAERANLAIRAIEAAGSFVGHPAKLGRPQGLAAKVAEVAGVSKDTALEQIAVLRDNELRLALAERRLTAAEAAKVVRLREKAAARQRQKEEWAVKAEEARVVRDLRAAEVTERVVAAAMERCRSDPDALRAVLTSFARLYARYGPRDEQIDALIAEWEVAE
jgi:hypothetical protein